MRKIFNYKNKRICYYKNVGVIVGKDRVIYLLKSLQYNFRHTRDFCIDIKERGGCYGE